MPLPPQSWPVSFRRACWLGTAVPRIPNACTVLAADARSHAKRNVSAERDPTPPTSPFVPSILLVPRERRKRWKSRPRETTEHGIRASVRVSSTPANRPLSPSLSLSAPFPGRRLIAEDTRSLASGAASSSASWRVCVWPTTNCGISFVSELDREGFALSVCLCLCVSYSRDSPRRNAVIAERSNEFLGGCHRGVIEQPNRRTADLPIEHYPSDDGQQVAANTNFNQLARLIKKRPCVWVFRNSHPSRRGWFFLSSSRLFVEADSAFPSSLPSPPPFLLAHFCQTPSL